MVYIYETIFLFQNHTENLSIPTSVYNDYEVKWDNNKKWKMYKNIFRYLRNIIDLTYTIIIQIFNYNLKSNSQIIVHNNIGDR